MSPKIVGKNILCNLLEAQAVRLRKKNAFKVVAVAGSVGKTSTKLAIAHTLSASTRVIYQEGNYNDRLTVPLTLFGHTLPGLMNLPAWIKILLANERTIKHSFPYDIAVLELGTDGPGQIAQFAYIKPDITVVTAITPEHMEFFKTLDAVASEELGVIGFSAQTVVNIDDCPERYLEGRTVQTYGLDEKADFRVMSWSSRGLDGISLEVKLGEETVSLASPMLGQSGAKITSAAAAVALLVGVAKTQIAEALVALPPTPGRMQILAGIHGSTIIDDTYNASPTAVKSGLDVLFSTKAQKRFAILGSMNELGDYSPEAHREVGAHCDPNALDLVVTIGKQAQDYLAPAAREAGCKVETFMDPYSAGKFLQDKLVEGAIVLGEGSQNGVFAEEALKQILNNPEDAAKLVRQSSHWMRIKHAQFGE